MLLSIQEGTAKHANLDSAVVMKRKTIKKRLSGANDVEKPVSINVN